jgi:hypothetical protein
LRYARILIGLIAVAFAATSSAAQKEVQYIGPPKWVIPVPTPTDSQTPDGASYRVVYELEVAVTIQHKDPTIGDHLFGFAQLPPTGQPGAFRIRMVMPTAAGSGAGWDG